MNLFSINSSVGFILNFFKEHVLENLTDQQKKVVYIATIIFSGMAIVAICRNYFKVKPLKQETEENLWLDKQQDVQSPNIIINREDLKKLNIDVIFSESLPVATSFSIGGITFHSNNDNRIQIAKDMKLNKENLIELDDFSNLTEKDYIYEGDLSLEQQAIRKCLEDPRLEELIQYIKQHPKDSKNRENALGALFVVLGIKPAIVFELDIEKKLKNILNKIKNDTLILSKRNNPQYFVNEQPLEAFNPRRFLEPLSNPQVSLYDAVQFCFANQNQLHTDQMLSYLLGFGPTWEAYSRKGSSGSKHTDIGVPSWFTDSHYQELGKVLLQEGNGIDIDSNEQNALIAGFAYHCQFPHLYKPRRGLKLIEHDARLVDTPFFELCSLTSTACAVDGISIRTEYVKKSYSLKKWTIETYFS